MNQETPITDETIVLRLTEEQITQIGAPKPIGSSPAGSAAAA